MSGRPAPNRGKKSHRRGFDSADSRQASSNSNHSGKYSTREQPPRFIRQRNGSNGGGGDQRDYQYEGYPSGRKDGGGHKVSGSRLQQGTAGSPSSGGRSSNLGKLCLTIVSLHSVDNQNIEYYQTTHVQRL